jgi:hypothetical protein
LFRNFDSHQAELEKLMNEIFIENALFIHFLDQRTNLFLGKLADVVTEQNLIFAEAGQRSGRGRLQRGVMHISTFKGDANWKF